MVPGKFNPKRENIETDSVYYVFWNRAIPVSISVFSFPEMVQWLQFFGTSYLSHTEKDHNMTRSFLVPKDDLKENLDGFDTWQGISMEYAAYQESLAGVNPAEVST